MNKDLLEILVCPVCQGKITWLSQQQVFLCEFDRLVYPVEEGIPVMLEEKAVQVSSEEKDAMLAKG